MHYSNILLLVFICASCAAPTGELSERAASRKIIYTGCSSDQQALVDGVLDDMQDLAKAAADASESANPSAAFSAFFGSDKDGGATNENINIRYHKLANFKKVGIKRDLEITCPPAPCCRAGRQGSGLACGVQTSDPEHPQRTISLCPPFWNWSHAARVYELEPPKSKTNIQITDAGYYTRGAVMLHEVMHFAYNAKDVVFDSDGGDGKTSAAVGYGHKQTLELASQSGVNARRNADTYAMFAMVSYYGGANKWEIDWRKLRD